MSDVLGICLLYLFAFLIVGGVSVATYVLVFKKYGNMVNKTDQNDVNKGKMRLKYCVNCGGEIDKKNVCVECKTKY